MFLKSLGFKQYRGESSVKITGNYMFLGVSIEGLLGSFKQKSVI